MTTSYPSGLDSFTNPTAGDELGDEVGSRTHSEMHADVNDALEAIETELGTDPSGSEATVKARISTVETSMVPRAERLSLAPSGALAETIPRGWAGLTNQTVLSTGRLSLVAVALTAGQVIASISFLSGTTALSAGTHQWFGLFDSSRVALRFTSNDTSTAWAGNAVKTLALTSSYTVLTTGLYYLGINVTATTVPTLTGYGNSSAAGLSIAPILVGTSDTGLTTVPALPFTATALTGTGTRPYAYCS